MTIDLLLEETRTAKIGYNEEQSNKEFAELAELVNELHDDYIRFFCYNNNTARVRVRKKLKEIIDKTIFMRAKTTIVKEIREKHGFKRVSYKKLSVADIEADK